MLGRAQHFYVVCVVSSRKKICGSKNPNFSRITSISKRFHYINGFFHFLRQPVGQSTWNQKNVTRRHVRIQKNIGSPTWYTRFFRDVSKTSRSQLFIFILLEIVSTFGADKACGMLIRHAGGLKRDNLIFVKLAGEAG